MYRITNRYDDILKNLFDKNDRFYYHWSISDLSEPKNAKMKDNVLTVDLPGVAKEDIELEFDNNIISIYIKDDDTKKYKITEGFEVENASMSCGRLLVKFKKKVGTKIEIS